MFVKEKKPVEATQKNQSNAGDGLSGWGKAFALNNARSEVRGDGLTELESRIFEANQNPKKDWTFEEMAAELGLSPEEPQILRFEDRETAFVLESGVMQTWAAPRDHEPEENITPKQRVDEIIKKNGPYKVKDGRVIFPTRKRLLFGGIAMQEVVNPEFYED